MEKTSMRKIREIMRLHFEVGLSANSIATSCNCARSVVQECLRKVKAAKLSWAQASAMDDTALETLLYPGPGKYPRAPIAPDWDYIHREKRKKGVTLELLWHEYQEQVTVPYSYSQFARLYQRWCKRLNVVMRQEHAAGQKLFVDYAVTVPQSAFLAFSENSNSIAKFRCRKRIICPKKNTPMNSTGATWWRSGKPVDLARLRFAGKKEFRSGHCRTGNGERRPPRVQDSSQSSAKDRNVAECKQASNLPPRKMRSRKALRHKRQPSYR